MSYFPWALLLLALPVVYSSCMFGRPQIDFDEATGQLDVYCRYGKVRIPFMEEYKDEQDCMKCTCNGDGLSCCGYGIKAGVMMVLPPCKIKTIGTCDYEIVKIANETEKC